MGCSSPKAHNYVKIVSMKKFEELLEAALKDLEEKKPSLEPLSPSGVNALNELEREAIANQIARTVMN